MEIVSRSSAAAQGLTKYYTGNPCKNGHLNYRYVQSGTCSDCIREASNGARASVQARTGAPLSPEQMAVRRDALVELVDIRVRAYPEDAGTLRAVAAAYCCAQYPTLAPADVHILVAPSDPAGGTFLYRVRVPSAHIDALRATANALLAARSSVDLNRFHAQQVEAAAALAPAPVPPEWGFK